jgi:hypothetical protein
VGFITDPRQWAEEVFGGCDLGDPRRTDRLVDYAARQALDPGGSTSRACRGDEAAREGAYRLLRNPRVEVSEIDDAAFDSVAAAASKHEVVLAVQDSTGVSFAHPVAEPLGSDGNPTGFFVHSTLLVAAATRLPVGIVDQERWVREPKVRGRAATERRAYEERESFKWQGAHERLCERMPRMESVVTVCDRESDVIEFLRYLRSVEGRFVIRSSADRKLRSLGRLWAHMDGQPELGRSEVGVGQRGGQLNRGGQNARLPRKQRTAEVAVYAAPVELSGTGGGVAVNAVLVREARAPRGEEPLEWMLLTSEPVSTLAEALLVVSYYEQRWTIEVWHKAWKTGCRVEHRPMQTLDNLERMMAITAHVAVRLLQLQLLGQAESESSCEQALARDEWQCLHAIAHPGKSVPRRPPTAGWALTSIARLGGWYDSKRTGRIGWQTLWHGWQLFQERLAGWRLALQTRGPRQ